MKLSDELLDRPGSLLEDHLRKVSRLTEERFAACLGEVDDDDLLLTARLTGLCHDLGKGTSYFQHYIRGAEGQREHWAFDFPRELTYHSRLGAEAAAFLLHRELGEESPLPLAAYGAILRHHGGLGDLEDMVGYKRADAQERKKLLKQIEMLDRDIWKKIVGKVSIDAFIEFVEDVPVLEVCCENTLDELSDDQRFRQFLLGRLLYSCLLWADRADASGTADLIIEPNPVGLVATHRVVEKFNKSTQGLNGLRNRAYEEVVEKVRGLDGSSRLFTLTLPTGLGKTLTGLAAALELRQKRGLRGPVIYCLPFTTIIDQNARVYKEVLKNNGLEATSDQLLIHHHLAESSYSSSKDSELDPDAGNLLIEGWESDLVVTTFVQLGLTLFSNHNRSLRRLHRLANAVVILDEVQNIPVRYWSLFRLLMRETASFLNTQWVLMTATQPAVFTTEDYPIELVEKRGVFFEGLSRTELKNETMEPLAISELATRILNEGNDKRILAVVNTVNCAIELHHELSEKTDVLLYFLSSEVIPKHRLERIQTIKEAKKPLICVSTQLIEAGVDLDFDVVYRDLAPLDSIIQAAGRCNRNGDESKTGRVVFVKLADGTTGHLFANYIYDPVLLNNTTRILRDKHVIRESELQPLIEDYYIQVKAATSNEDSMRLIESARSSNHQHLAESFRLIEQNWEKVDVFVTLCDGAERIWEEYQQALELEGRERCNKMHDLKPKLARYTISVPKQYWHNEKDEWLSYIGKEEIERYYKTTTGFIRQRK